MQNMDQVNGPILWAEGRGVGGGVTSTQIVPRNFVYVISLWNTKILKEGAFANAI